jgi:hypothetical protein
MNIRITSNSTDAKSGAAGLNVMQSISKFYFVGSILSGVGLGLFVTAIISKIK